MTRKQSTAPYITIRRLVRVLRDLLADLDKLATTVPPETLRHRAAARHLLAQTTEGEP